jgi:ActR/RegA family two-component response regulator
MLLETQGQPRTIGPAVTPNEEVAMVRQERWDEIRRLGLVDRVSIAALARQFDLDRKTVRRCHARRHVAPVPAGDPPRERPDRLR